MDNLAAAEGLPMILVGDFNIPEIQWVSKLHKSPTSPQLRKKSSRASTLTSICNEMKLRQWVDKPTRKDNILDLVFTSESLAKVDVTVNKSRFRTDHEEIVIHITL